MKIKHEISSARSAVMLGRRCEFDGNFCPDEDPQVLATTKYLQANCLFIGMRTPSKERFLAPSRDQLAVMVVDDGLDILVGHVRRAVQEPLRLGP